MKKLFFIAAILFLTNAAFAQSSKSSPSSQNKTTITETTIDSAINKSYIELSGGYLFKNKILFDDPMWYLDNGSFLELNGGIKGKTFGWSAALGYLTLDRNKGQFDKIWLDGQMVYDSAMGGTYPSDITGLNDHSIYFGPKHEISESKPFRGFYLMTGPNVWLGKDKLKVNIALEGGIGYSQAGYYHVKGFSGATADSLMIVEANTPTGRGSTPYDVKVLGAQYEQYGMSGKYYDKISSSTLANPFEEKEPYEIHPMARLTANVEYFVTPRISVHGGANLWYIFSPKMTGEQTVSGEAVQYLNPKTGRPDYQHPFSYTKPYKEKDLTLASANVGVKVWFGKTSVTKTTVKEEKTEYEELADAKKNQEQKNLLINVVDKLTKTPMGGVEVNVKDKRTGKTRKETTADNGTLEIKDIEPGAYEIEGAVYGISTTSEEIASSDFAREGSTLRKTLFYDDPRFVLKGVAVNKADGAPEAEVKVSLEKGEKKVSHAKTNESGNFDFLLETNSDYQVQGLKNGLFSNVAETSTKGLKRSQTLYVKLKLGMDKVEVGKSFVINNILYDFDDAAIRPDAAIELDRLVAFLKENPETHIELSSHTDSRGNNAYNLQLSQRRAQSAVDYIISRGISTSRLVAKGYGETKLVNGCADGVSCSEAEHQANRRTEIKIIE